MSVACASLEAVSYTSKDIISRADIPWLQRATTKLIIINLLIDKSWITAFLRKFAKNTNTSVHLNTLTFGFAYWL